MMFMSWGLILVLAMKFEKQLIGVEDVVKFMTAIDEIN